MHYRHVIFVRKDTHIKYVFEMILLKKVLSKKIFPLHARVVDFFDTVEGKNYQCASYNIYNSDTFFKEEYNNE